MSSFRAFPRLFVLLATVVVFTRKTSVAFTSANALSHPKNNLAFTTLHPSSPRDILQQRQRLLTTLRGGGDPATAESTTETKSGMLQSRQMSAVVAFALAGASRYSQALERYPIGTKSVTAAVIFMISDLVAQRIERSDDNAKLDKKRTLTASLVGLLYFGPAAHVWYDNIFRLFPGTLRRCLMRRCCRRMLQVLAFVSFLTFSISCFSFLGTSLFSTLQKAAMGQLVFGPSFTCVFFATSLLQSGEFTIGNWVHKIKADLPGAWLSGAGFWPLVDLISYSLIPQRWIPLFINVCSLIWNVYLSMVANRKTGSSSSKR